MLDKSYLHAVKVDDVIVNEPYLPTLLPDISVVNVLPTSISAASVTPLQDVSYLGRLFVIIDIVGGSFTFSTVILKEVSTDALAVSVALNLIFNVPTSAFRGVPENVLVDAVKVDNHVPDNDVPSPLNAV